MPSRVAKNEKSVLFLMAAFYFFLCEEKIARKNCFFFFSFRWLRICGFEVRYLNESLRFGIFDMAGVCRALFGSPVVVNYPGLARKGGTGTRYHRDANLM